MFVHDSFNGSRRTKSKDDLAVILQEKLRELGYFPVYITSDLERRIRELQEEELRLRKNDKFTLDDGVNMLKEIDSINIELNRLSKDYRKEMLTKAMAQQSEVGEEARKRKAAKVKTKRKVVKKVIKHKIKK